MRPGRLVAAFACCVVVLACAPEPTAIESTAATEAGTTTATTIARSDPADGAAPTSTLDLPGGVSGELILTRQRDLLDRGLINVQLRNDSEIELTITERQLIIEHFDTPPAAPRTSAIPKGRLVNLQVPYGVANDCDVPGPVDAWLEFSFSEAGSSHESVARLPLTGTGLLDTIRAEQCVQRTFDELVEVSFSEPVVDGDAFRVDAIFTPTTPSDGQVGVQRAFGTILVGVDAPALPVSVDLQADATVIALEFFVIRCDPHAIAEVTKRFGLEMLLSVGGGPTQLVDIDLAPLDAALTGIVEHCRQQSADDP